MDLSGRWDRLGLTDPMDPKAKDRKEKDRKATAPKEKDRMGLDHHRCLLCCCRRSGSG